jgi:hypothetical protein
MPNAEGVRLEKFQTHSHPPQLPVAQSGLPVRVGFDQNSINRLFWVRPTGSESSKRKA